MHEVYWIIYLLNVSEVCPQTLTKRVSKLCEYLPDFVAVKEMGLYNSFIAEKIVCLQNLYIWKE